MASDLEFPIPQLRSYLRVFVHRILCDEALTDDRQE